MLRTFEEVSVLEPGEAGEVVVAVPAVLALGNGEQQGDRGLGLAGWGARHRACRNRHFWCCRLIVLG